MTTLLPTLHRHIYCGSRSNDALPSNMRCRRQINRFWIDYLAVEKANNSFLVFLEVGLSTALFCRWDMPFPLPIFSLLSPVFFLNNVSMCTLGAVGVQYAQWKLNSLEACQWSAVTIQMLCLDVATQQSRNNSPSRPSINQRDVASIGVVIWRSRSLAVPSITLAI